jgi:Fe-S-cluster containining protein
MLHHAAFSLSRVPLQCPPRIPRIGPLKAAHIAEWRKSVLCAFNRGGECSIYPVRPTICRSAHAVDTAAYCTGAAELPAVRVAFANLDSARTSALR